MKLNDIIIFLFILLLFAISIIFGHYLKNLYIPSPLPSNHPEGFIAYNYDANNKEYMKDTTIKNYSSTKKVDKLYDNIYYDKTNGSIIMVKGKQYSLFDDSTNSTIADTTGDTITGYLLWDRTGSSKTISGQPSLTEDAQSKVNTLTESFKHFKIIIDNETDKYEVLYIPWNKETYIHIIQLKETLFNVNTTDTEYVRIHTELINATTISNTAKTVVDAKKATAQTKQTETQSAAPTNTASITASETLLLGVEVSLNSYKNALDKYNTGLSIDSSTMSTEVDVITKSVNDAVSGTDFTAIPTSPYKTKIIDYKTALTEYNTALTAYKTALNTVKTTRTELNTFIETKKEVNVDRIHLRTYAYNSEGTNRSTDETKGGITYDATPIPQTYSVTKTTTDDKTYTNMYRYSSTHQLYQICTNLKYDYLNGNLLSQENDSTLLIYSRPTSGLDSSALTPEKIDLTSVRNITLGTSIADISGFSSGIINVKQNKEQNDIYTVLYIAVGTRTILVTLMLSASDSSSATFDFRNVSLFDNSKKLVDMGTSNSYSGGFSSNGSGPLNSYQLYQMLMYLQGSPDGNLYNTPITNDYILKTQIVPPVCPTCPLCPSNSGVCTNCGGKGGSGTQNGGSNGGGKGNDDDSVVDLLESAGSGATSLVRDTGSGAASLARDTASGTVGLAKDTVGGAVGLAKETVGGTVGLAKETVGGAVGLAKDAGSGIANTFGKINPTIVSSDSGVSQSSGSSGTSGGYSSAGTGASSNVPTGSDHTSYYGAIPAKAGDYIPVTADFSRFGR